MTPYLLQIGQGIIIYVKRNVHISYVFSLQFANLLLVSSRNEASWQLVGFDVISHIGSWEIKTNKKIDE